MSDTCAHGRLREACYTCYAAARPGEFEHDANHGDTPRTKAYTYIELANLFVQGGDPRPRLDWKRVVATAMELDQRKMADIPRCTVRWRAGVLSTPGERRIPNGARCTLMPHGDDVQHDYGRHRE